MENNSDIELRSEEIQEIIGEVPGKLVRFGIGAVLTTVLTILLILWFIKYPDLLTADIVITTDPSPINIVARSAGKLVLLKKENESCEKGEIIAYIQSNADLRSILFLENVLRRRGYDNTEIQPTKMVLGDIQPYFSRFLVARNALHFFHANKQFQEQIRLLRNQITTYSNISNSLKAQQELAAEELTLAREKYLTDSILFLQKVYSALDFNQARNEWVQRQRLTQGLETTFLSNQANIDQIEKQIFDLSIDHRDLILRLTTEASNSGQELEAQIMKWKETYLFTANESGRMAKLGFLEDYMPIEIGQSVFSILPSGSNIIGRATLPVNGSGRVKIGHRVNVRLSNFPYSQYGILNGTIKSISELPNDQSYLIEIELPDELVTSTDFHIQFKQKLLGTAQIVTDDSSLMLRFLYHLQGFF